MDIEQRAFWSYHHDGLVEIAVSIVLVLFGIGLLLDLTALSGIWAVCGFSFYSIAKQMITIPRIGAVRAGGERTKRYLYFRFFILILVGIFFLLGIGLFLLFSNGPIPPWIDAVFDLFFMNDRLFFGIIFSVLAALFAFWMELPRFYGYAMTIFIVFATGKLLDIALFTLFISLGAIILIAGIVILSRFMHDNPVQKRQTGGGA